MSLRSRGVTLIELIVALVILGVAASLAAVRLPDAPVADPTMSALRAARARAVRSGRPVIAVIADTVQVRFAPDGSATGGRWCSGDACWTVDPWTGQVHRD